MLQLGVLVSGRGSNLQAIIDEIESGALAAEIGIVVSDNSEAKALDRAENHDLKNIYLNPQEYDTDLEYETALCDLLKENDVELVIMAGFMRILSPFFISQYRYQIMNIHPSLLPAFPGLNAQKQALEYGVKISGCTVHFAEEGMDSGPIILQKAVEVKKDDTVDSLAARILKEEHRLYPEAIRLFTRDRLSINKGKVIIKDD